MKRILTLVLCCLLLTGCGQPAVTAHALSRPHREPTEAMLTRPALLKPYDYTLTFVGDVSLADGSDPVKAYQRRGLEGCFSPEILDAMRKADLMCLNSEFSFTTRGTKVEKNFNFRGDPERVHIFEDMGVDIAILANNHVFDYGEEGLTDTINTFKQSTIAGVGAGENLDEASATYYAELDGCTVAYVAGCRVEWSRQTRGATETQSGVFRTAESNALICQRIAEAREKADFVVVYMHWGMEGTSQPEPYQLATGKQLIEAGADVVVGDHPHQLQGIDFHNGKPIFYSLGNYWFSRFGKYTTLLNMELHRSADGEVRVDYRLTPAWTEGGTVTTVPDEAAFYRFVQNLCPKGVTIDEQGYVKER